MNRTALLALFATVTAVAQLAVPLQLAWKSEQTLRRGESVRFRTAPVDPADPFRGRYVALNFDWPELTIPEGFTARRGGTELVWAIVEIAPDGFSTIERVQLEAPASGELGFRVQGYRSWGDRLRLRPHFNQLFLPEPDAPAAEAAYLQANRRTAQTDARADDDPAETAPPETYAVVRIHDGEALLENVYVEDLPLAQWATEVAER